MSKALVRKELSQLLLIPGLHMTRGVWDDTICFPVLRHPALAVSMLYFYMSLR